MRAVDAFGTMFRTNLSRYIFYIQELAACLPFIHQCKVHAELNQTVLSDRNVSQLRFDTDLAFVSLRKWWSVKTAMGLNASHPGGVPLGSLPLPQLASRSPPVPLSTTGR